MTPKADQLLRVDMESWSFAVRNNMPEFYRAYLEKFPEGQFAKMAQAWLARDDAKRTALEKPRMDGARVLSAVSAVSGIKLDNLTCQRRARRLARPRQVAMYLMREYTPLTLPQIGRIVGGRDHTTVMHAVRVIDRIIADQSDLGLIGLLNAAKARLDAQAS